MSASRTAAPPQSVRLAIRAARAVSGPISSRETWTNSGTSSNRATTAALRGCARAWMTVGHIR